MTNLDLEGFKEISFEESFVVNGGTFDGAAVFGLISSLFNNLSGFISSTIPLLSGVIIPISNTVQGLISSLISIGSNI